ncbi:MAG: exo-alpha-sialidase [Opitutaceae bacterium]
MALSRRSFLQTTVTSLAIGAAGSAAPRLIASPSTPNGTSPITNAWGRARTTKVPTEEYTIFKGFAGQSYSHQSQLTSHEGKLYATWSLGLRDEEGPGQRMVMAVSDDLGQTWGKPITIAPYRRGLYSDTTVISSGLRIHGDLFIAYNGEWERKQVGLNADGTRNRQNTTDLFLNSRTEARISRDRGLTWSNPLLIAAGFVNYMPPVPLRGGRLIFPGNLAHLITDDPTGLTDWRRTAVPGIPHHYVDDYFNKAVGRQLAGNDFECTEASSFQTDDGVIHMMLRNDTGFLMSVSESRDNGESWSKPRLTDYTDVRCRAQFGRLADGRFFGMNCPKSSSPTNVRHRTPAVLATSMDGVSFDRHYILGDEPEGIPSFDGLYKHGRYGYPYLHVHGEHGFMIFSRNKEDICVSRFALAAIS